MGLNLPVSSGSSEPLPSIFGGGLGGTLGSGVTRYCSPYSAIGAGVETRSQNFPCPFDIDFETLFVRLSGAQPASGSLVFTLKKNGVDTAAVLTIPGSSPAGLYSAAAPISFSVGDFLYVKIVNGATATSAAITGWWLE